MLKIYEDSKNYTCQVIKLPAMQAVIGLDNLMEVNVQGNSCLIGKDSNPDELYLFFPTECQISHEFLSKNNLYRHSELNEDKTKKGFFEDNRRVRSVKFKGVISSGFTIPVKESLFSKLTDIKSSYIYNLKIGDEFNEIEGVEICRKYIKPQEKNSGMSNPRVKIIDNIVDSRMFPEHFSTEHLLKNLDKLELTDYIAVNYKLHGTSARYSNTLVKKHLSWWEKGLKKLGVNIVDQHYDYVCGSRKCIKSVGFEELPNKNHFYNSRDLWSAVGKEFFEGKLNQGETVYCEIIGKTYSGEAIQHGYSYGFEKPQVYVYRISNINPQGIELDLSHQEIKERAIQLNLNFCPELFYGKLIDFLNLYYQGYGDSFSNFYTDNFEKVISDLFYKKLLEQPSILDSSVVEEGFVIRKDKLGKPLLLKIKSKKFLLHESGMLDKELINIEEEQTN